MLCAILIFETTLLDLCSRDVQITQLRSHVIFCHHHCSVSVQMPYMAVLEFESGKALCLLSERGPRAHAHTRSLAIALQSSFSSTVHAQRDASTKFDKYNQSHTGCDPTLM